MCFVSAHAVYLYCSFDTTAAYKKPCFISSNGSDFQMIYSLSIAVNIHLAKVHIDITFSGSDTAAEVHEDVN